MTTQDRLFRPAMSAGRAALRKASQSLAAISLVASLTTSLPVHAQEQTVSSSRTSAVIELFSSQGCTSCPPAERIFAEMAKESDIVALAYHVDYWDYIGWSDTLGSKANTERQRAYARSFGTSTIYTPQVVVNGRKDVIGSREADIRRAIADVPLGAGGASVAMRRIGDRMHITASVGDTAGQVPVLMLVNFSPPSRVEVTRGENKGKTILNANPVTDWQILGMFNGKPLEVDMPLSGLRRSGRPTGGCAALIQTVTAEGGPGPILAAAVLQFGGS